MRTKERDEDEKVRRARTAARLWKLRLQKCQKPGAAMCASQWEAEHQRRALEDHGLADEFPYGCDAIQHVAEALVLARAEAQRWEEYTGGTMKVYLVTSGQCSDYEVVAVFTSKEKAQSYATGIYGANDVEEFDLDPVEPPRLPEGMGYFCVIITERDGASSAYDDYYEPQHGMFVNEGWEVLKQSTGALILRIRTIAKDKQHAIKIASERRASLIATGNFKEGVSSETFK